MEWTNALGYTWSPSSGADAPHHEHSEVAVDNEQDSAGVSRGQNQLHVQPEEWESAAVLIEPLLDRLEANPGAGIGVGGAQLLIITNDAEAAAGIAGRLAPRASQRELRVLAVTDARRGARVIRASSTHVIAAPPAALVELMQSSVLKLDSVRAVVLAWVEDLGASPTRALETVVAEVPKDAARVVIVNEVTPAVEQLVERYARRARKVQPAQADPLPAVSLSYVSVNDVGRIPGLRRLLDALDPESAFVLARNPESLSAVEYLLRSLGYGENSPLVSAGETLEGSAQLIVLFDFPANEGELRKAVSGRPQTRVVALVTPRQISALRRFAGGSVTPLILPEAAARARTREEALRDELRATLATGQFSRELLALEPLLSEHDGAEVAAAALRLLETERSKPQAPAAAAQAMTRLYLNVGSMDNVRPGDLVGAITNEAGISKAELGRVDVRERHSTVEVATALANAVVAKLTGVSIRNRRVVARVDEGSERPRRDDVRLGARDAPGGRGGPPPRGRGGPPRAGGSRPPRDRKGGGGEDRPRRGGDRT